MSSIHNSDNQMDLKDSLSQTPNETTEVNDILTSSSDPGLFFGDANCSTDEGIGRGQIEDYHLHLYEEYKNRDVGQEGIKFLTFEYQKVGEPMLSPAYGTSGCCLEANKEKDHATMSTAFEVHNYADKMSEAAPMNTLEITMNDNPHQTPTRNVITSFCLRMAIHILLTEAEEGSNFVFSPLSFHLMLSLIAVGLTGPALNQLLSLLESESINKLNTVSSQIATSVLLPANESNDLTRGPSVSFINAAWVDLRFCLKPSFKEVVEGVFHATAKEVDFENKANEVIDEANSWAENATQGLIRDLLPPDCLDSDTVLVLANALYFKGAWDRKLDASKTTHKDFHLLNGNNVQVPFMTSHKYERHLYGSFDGYKVLKLPYQNGQDNRQFCMYFFLPDARDGLHNLIPIFKSNPEIYNGKLMLEEEDLPDFWIPRFKFSFKFEASKPMKELGLELLFSDVGQFTEMVDPAESLILSKIFHESCIEVNEEGTEAAASTAPLFRFLSARLNPPSFVADHPFMFMIKEENSGTVFFIGAVLNPLLVS